MLPRGRWSRHLVNLVTLGLLVGGAAALIRGDLQRWMQPQLTEEVPNQDQSGLTDSRPAVSEVVVPYLVIDVHTREMSVRLADVILRQYAFEILDDSETIADLVTDWPDSSLEVRTVTDVRLLSAAPSLSPAELSILAEEAHLDETLVQRYIPALMVLTVSGGFAVRVETDGQDAQSYFWEHVRERFRRFKHWITGRDSLRIHLAAQDAASLFGLAQSHPKVLVK